MSNKNKNQDKDLFIWSETEPDDYRKWCYAGGRRYVFADSILVNNQGYQGFVYDIDLDTFNLSDYNIDDEDLEYIESLTDDYERAYAIADCIQPTNETSVLPTEDAMWEEVSKIIK